MGSLALCDKRCTFPFLDPSQNGPPESLSTRRGGFCSAIVFFFHFFSFFFPIHKHSADTRVSGPLHRSRPSCHCWGSSRLELECEPTFYYPRSSAVSRRRLLLSNALVLRLGSSHSGSHPHPDTHTHGLHLTPNREKPASRPPIVPSVPVIPSSICTLPWALSPTNRDVGHPTSQLPSHPFRTSSENPLYKSRGHQWRVHQQLMGGPDGKRCRQ